MKPLFNAANRAVLGHKEPVKAGTGPATVRGRHEGQRMPTTIPCQNSPRSLCSEATFSCPNVTGTYSQFMSVS